MLNYILPFLATMLVIIIAIIYAAITSPEKTYATINSSGKRKSNHQYGVKCVTGNGEEVRSISEQKIADYFSENKIRYVYEKEVRARSGRFSNYRIGRPDFYLPDYDVYVEYWGLVDAEDNYTRKQYVRSMKRKMARYYENNIKFISIYPRNMDNLDWIFKKKFENVTGRQLIN